MGYTHYWTSNFDGSEAQVLTWREAIAECEIICKTAKTEDGDVYHFGWQIKDDELRIFGGGEWFVMPVEPDAIEWSFCKTNRRTYDTVVVACLCVLAETGILKVTSDGRWQEWTEGLDLARIILERPTIPNPLAKPAPSSPTLWKPEPRKIRKGLRLSRLD